VHIAAEGEDLAKTSNWLLIGQRSVLALRLAHAEIVEINTNVTGRRVSKCV